MRHPQSIISSLASSLIGGMVLLLTFSHSACTSKARQSEAKSTLLPQMHVTNLEASLDPEFSLISQVFAERNSCYELFYEHSVSSIEAQDYQQVLFAQEGQPTISFSSGERSKTSVGEIILLAQ